MNILLTILIGFFFTAVAKFLMRKHGPEGFVISVLPGIAPPVCRKGE